MALRKNKPALVATVFCGLILAVAVGFTAYFVPLTNSLNAELKSSNTMIAQLNDTLTAENSTINYQSGIISSLNTIVNEQNSQIATLNRTVDKQTSTIENQSSQISSFQSDIASLNLQAANMSEQINNLSATINRQELVIKNQTDAIQNLTNQLASYLNTANSLTNDVCFCLHVQDFDNNTISLMRELDVTWVRSDWLPDYNVTDVFSQLAANNIKILCIIDANSVGPYNDSTWNASVSNIVSAPGATYVSAWEIWNEPNIDMSAGQYYQALKSAYTIIKNYRSSQTVVSAGLAPIETSFGDYLTYYQSLYSNPDFTKYMDVQGVHLYSDNSQNNMNDLNAVKGKVGNATIWVTEIGLPSGPSPYDENTQANFVKSNWSVLRSRAYEIFWYEFKDYLGSSTTRKATLGQLQRMMPRNLPTG